MGLCVVLFFPTLAYLLLCTTPSAADILYPYGASYDTPTSKVDDGSTLITLSTSIKLFGNVSTLMHVNNNGLLSFSSGISAYTPTHLPVTDGNPFLAPFWADVNNALAGDIFYRQSNNDTSLLSRAATDIRTYFGLQTFSATWVFVATWSNVAFFGSSSSSTTVNTFQAVLISNGSFTFVMFNYGNILWTTGRGSGGDIKGTGGKPALAGVNSGLNTGYYEIPTSLTADIINITSTTNVNVNGRWVIRVDKLHPRDVNGVIALKGNKDIK
ncbi:sushi, nidogen and EGF-like domain-containing protein 1 isoform X2 [Hyperolius riggenbachi]|uniref:sushi, nidogen and EGF-like domain-containing protein 1 isoform X2 n=1 Tax=Hyperolius riggenbachi TaxID=752182 RepID=UPI0035A2CBE1